MGYKEYKEAERIESLPVMMGWQAEGAAPIVRGEVIDAPETVATAIRIGNPASWQLAIEASEESSGTIDSVTDEEILDAHRMLARTEGIFVEPASAAGIAGIVKSNARGDIPKNSTLVVTVTGHGLKDPAIAIENSAAKSVVVDPDLESVRMQSECNEYGYCCLANPTSWMTTFQTAHSPLEPSGPEPTTWRGPQSLLYSPPLPISSMTTGIEIGPMAASTR